MYYVSNATASSKYPNFKLEVHLKNVLPSDVLPTKHVLPTYALPAKHE